VKFTLNTIWPWLVLALVLLGVATTYSTFQVSQDTYRFLFVVDITQSMNVSDMELQDAVTTRFEFAKSAIETAFSDLPCGSEAGLGIFTAHRTFVMFTPVEICEHFNALSDMLEKVNWRMAWTARSEVAKGLYSAIDAARQSEHETRLVFLTDGHEAPPLNRSIRPPFRAEPGSVEGFIAGVGGHVPGRIPHFDDYGNIVGYWSHEEVMQIDIHSLGRPASEQGELMVGINMQKENHLQELAEQTGLNYVRIDSPSHFVENLRKEKYARRTPVLSDMGWIPATLAFGCLIYCFVVVPWRSASGRGPRPEQPARIG